MTAILGEHQMATQNPPESRLFIWLDRLFWLLWPAFAGMILLAYMATVTGDQQIAASGTIKEECLAQLPRFSAFSAGGKTAYWVLFSFEFLVYGALLALAHLMIHRFARGRVFVADTLSSLKWLGMIVTAWPFYEILSSNGLTYALYRLGDLKLFQPTLVPDLPVFAVGLMILTLYAVMRRAIELKTDTDLTI